MHGFAALAAFALAAVAALGLLVVIGGALTTSHNGAHTFVIQSMTL
jgi:hypothetical protein